MREEKEGGEGRGVGGTERGGERWGGGDSFQKRFIFFEKVSSYPNFFDPFKNFNQIWHLIF